MNRGMLPLFLFAGLVLLLSCSNNDNPASPSPASGVNQYFGDLPDWNTFSPQLTPPDSTSDVTVGATTDSIFYNSDDQQYYVRHTTPHSLAATPEDIVTFSPTSNVLYVGALIQGQSYLDGNLEELPIRQRAPLTLSIDILNSDNTATVQDPTLATVNAAVQQLITRAADAGHSAGNDLYFSKHEAYSLKQSLLSLGFSARYGLASVSGTLRCSQTAEEHTLTAYFKQKMFTVSMVLPQTPSELFSSDFTHDLLQQQIDLGRIGPDNLPVFVANIEYGRIMILTMTSTNSIQEMEAALRASYASIAGGSVDTDLLNILQGSDIRIVTVGGDATTAVADMQNGNLGAYFASDADITTAKPLAYTLRNVADNSIAYMSETTSYDVTEYTNDVVAYYGDYDHWHDAVLDMSGQIFTQSSAGDSLVQSDEYTSPPLNNTGSFPTITFRGANTGLPFDYVLDALQSGATFVYNDNEFDSGYYPCLSVGKANIKEDDDFDVKITTTVAPVEVRAIGIYVGDNTSEPGEELRVYGENDMLLKIFPSTTSGFPNRSTPPAQFMGVISVLPLTRIYFNEGSGGDDILIKNPCFGVTTGAGSVTGGR